MSYKIEFDDGDQFGDMTFLDILEDKGISFSFDGKFLELHDRVDELEARRLWGQLTGCSLFGRRLRSDI